MNTFRSFFCAGIFASLGIAVTASAFGQDGNPNRATSGNNDPTRGVRGENQNPVNSGLPGNPSNQTPEAATNPNRATSGNTDPAHGIKGQNEMRVNSGLAPNPIDQTPRTEVNPNRASSGNSDPAHGVKGENFMEVNSGRSAYPSLYLKSPSTFAPSNSVGRQPIARPAIRVSERDRTRQIFLQIQGYGAFNDADVWRKLGLTDSQRKKFQQLDLDSAQRMAMTNSASINNGRSIDEGFENYEKDFQTNVATTLTSVQLDQWNALIGRPFGIGSEHFAQTSPVKTTTAKPVLK